MKPEEIDALYTNLAPKAEVRDKDLDHIFAANQPGPTIGDYAKSLAVGGVNLATQAGQGLRSAGVGIGTPIRDLAQRGEKGLTESMTPGGQEALSAMPVEFNGSFDPRDWKAGATPVASTLMQTAQSAPSMIGAYFLGKPAYGALNAAKVGEGIATRLTRAGVSAPRAAKVGETLEAGVPFGAAEGVQAGLQNAAQSAQQLQEMKQSDLEKSPAYQREFADTPLALPMDERQRLAREAISHKVEGEIIARTTPTTGALGLVTEGGVLGQIAKKQSKGIIREVLGGAGKEGLQEALQSPAEQVIQNLATRNYVNPDQNIWQGVPESAVAGALSGALLGAGGGAGHAAIAPSSEAEVAQKPPGGPLEAAAQTAHASGATQPSFPFTSAEAAQRRANTMSSATGEAWAVGPHPQMPDRFIVSPAAELEAAAAKAKGEEGGVEKSVENVTKGSTAENLYTPPTTEGQTTGSHWDAIEADQTHQKETQLDQLQQDSQHAKAEFDAEVTRRMTGGEPLETAMQSAFAAIKQREAIDTAAHEAATSPLSHRPFPTEAQKKAGNYQLGHPQKIQGLNISIENPAGSVRRGTDAEGKPWENVMPAHYGYIRGTEAADGHKLDVYVGPNPGRPTVFVVDQDDPETGKFDEHKVMLGFDNAADAEAAYHAAYKPDWQGFGGMTPMPVADFKQWIKDPNNLKSPLGASHAETLRSDAGQVRSGGDGLQPSPNQGGENLQRDQEAQGTQAIEQAGGVQKEAGPAAVPTGLPEAGVGEAAAVAPAKRVARLAKAAKARRTVDTTQDSLFTAIGKLGGLNMDDARKTWGLDPKDRFVSGIFGRPVLTKKGRSLDDMTQVLAQHGYLPTDEHGRADITALEEAFAREHGGQRVFTGQGIEQEAEARAAELGHSMELADEEARHAGFDDLTPEGQDTVATIIENDFLDMGGRRMSDDEIDQWLDQGARDVAKPAAQGTGEGATGRQKPHEAALGPPAFGLASETEADIKRREAEVATSEKAKEAESARLEAKRSADLEREGFGLTGSDRAADVNPNQQALFGNTPAKAKSAERRQAGGREGAADRRQDTERRQRVADMSVEEMRRALLTDPLTGLGNRRAYEEAPKLKHQASIDVDSLKWVNDHLGHAAGDEMLRIVGEALAAETDQAFHVSGDEFVAQHDDEAVLRTQLDAARARLAAATVEAIKPDGAIITLKGVGYSYGTGTDLKIAEHGLHRQKLEREAAGERAARGETPRGATETPQPAVGHPAEDHPTAETPQKAVVAPETPPLQTPKTDAKIADFGEKIAGARKDYAAKLKEAQAADVASVPLSQSWPEPDYQKLLDGGADAWAVAFMHAARDEIPTKPQTSWKLKGWVSKVETLRDFASGLTDGRMDVPEVKGLFENNRFLDPVRERVDLYLAVGHEKSLKGLRISVGEYSVFNGVEYKPAKKLWSVEGKTVNGRWPKQLAVADTREEAIANFKKVWLATTPDEDAKKAVDFGIYSRDKTYFVGKKIGKGVIELKGGFTNVKEARAWKDANQDELVRLLEKFKEVPSERRESNSPRIGIDHRNGADVTPERFGEAFGFRGVQFGNYVENTRRQQDLNESYDALMDLAGVLQIPPKALSLNGELGVAFGARGSGGKLAPGAHYEPKQIVINLTKTRGAGSLAHEWFHAVDNYFSRSGGNKLGFLTESQAIKEGVRPEMLAAFKEVMRAIKATEIPARSRKLDTTRSKDYWSTNLEMAARAFEANIIAKLQDQNAANDYLANIVSKAYWDAAAALGVEKENTYPYPTAEEMPAIREAFDKFFQTVETRETDKGIQLYSRATREGETPQFTRTAIAKRIEAIRSGWKNAPPIEVTQRIKDLPPAVRAEIARVGGEQDVEGLFHDGKVYLVADNIASIDRAEAVLLHETVGHYGLRSLLGDQLNAELNRIFLSNTSTRDEAGKRMAQFGYSREVATEEVLAEMAERGEKPNGWQRFVAFVRDALRSLGFKLKMSDTDVRNLIANAGKMVRGDHLAGAGKVIGATPTLASRDAPVFYSELAAKLSAHKQAAASPEQWTALIKNLPGVKADEVNFSGVNEWLQLQGPKVTREQVLDYLKQGGVKVEETQLGNDDRYVRDENGDRILDGTGGFVERAANTKFAQYQLPGGEHYRELLLTLPATKAPKKQYEIKKEGNHFRVYEQNASDWVSQHPSEEQARERIAENRFRDNMAASSKSDFKSSHFDQPNILAHVRFNERADADGKKVLFIEELQSDWAQKGKKEGFGTGEIKIEHRPLTVDEAVRAGLRRGALAGSIALDKLNYVATKDGRVVGIGDTEEEARRYAATDARTTVPSGPFVGKTEAWTGLALKRMIRYAADNGFDRIAWTTGEQQAERYDLSKQIDSIHYNPDTQRLVAKKGEARVIDKQAIKPEKLEDYVGKEVAKKLMEQEPNVNGLRSLSGDGLKVGGEGMQAFYDKIVPNVANDVLKKFGGGRVGQVAIDRTDYGATGRTPEKAKYATFGEQPGFDITPELRDRALGGLPLFSRRSPNEAFNNLREGTQQWLSNASSNDRSISPLMRSINTQYHKAETLAAQGKPEFKQVFDLGQRFLSDTTLLAAQAAQLAPNILHQPRSLTDFSGGAKEVDLQAIDKALNEGTLYGGGDPVAGVRWSDEQLRKRYQLTDTQIRLYREYLEATAESVDIMAKAQIAAHAKQNDVAFDRDYSLPDMAAKVVESLDDLLTEAHLALEYASDQNRINDEAADLADMDKPHLADQLRRDAERQAIDAEAKIDRIVKTIADVKAIAERAKLLREAGYKPLMRFGEHTVTARDATGQVAFYGMYEGTSLAPRAGQVQANQVAAALRADNPDWQVETGVMSKEGYKLYAGINLEALQLFAEHMDAEAKAPYQEYLRQAVNNRSAMKRMIHRQGTPGFSQDARRTLAQFVLSNGRLAASQYNLTDMRKAAEAIPNAQGDIKDEAVKLHEYLTKPKEEAARFRGFLFFNYLGGSIASAMVNLTQVPAVTAPYLTQHTSYANAVKELVAAAKIALQDPAKLTGDVGEALRKAEADGVTAPQEIFQLMALASNSVFAGAKVARLAMHAWGKLFSVAEQFNRRTTFIAAYRIGIEQGKSKEAAFAFAETAVNDTQFIYNKGNRPNWARGAAGSVLFTFKQFNIAYLELFKRMSPKQRAVMLGTFLVFAGAGGLPFEEDIEDLVDTLGQWFGFATNAKRTVRNAAKAVLGETGSDVLMRGVSAGLPFDVAGRMGMANLIPGSAILKPSEADKTRDVAEALGPLGSLVRSTGDALSSLATGHFERAALDLAPTAVRNAYMGSKMLTKGYAEDMSGRKTLDVTPVEGVAKTLGFQPGTLAQFSEIKQGLQESRNLMTVKQNEINTLWAEAILSHDPDGIAAAKEKLIVWNHANPDMPLRFDPAAVRKRVIEAQMAGDLRFLHGLPKGMRAGAKQELGL